MSVLHQMWTEKELAAFDPAVRERIQLGVAAGARIAAVMEKGQRSISVVAGREEAIKIAAAHYNQALLAEKAHLANAELGQLNKLLKG